MSASLGEEWGLLQKCSRFIANNISWIPLAPGTERPLSNDQKFTEYEIKKASVATQLEPDVPESLKGRTDGVAHLENLLQFLDDLIDAEILELCPVEGGGFKKLQSIARLLDGKEAELNRFLKPAEDDPAEAKTRATRFNEFMEHLSALKPAAPTCKQRIRGGSKLKESLELASQLQRLSHCLFKTLVHNSSCCGEAGSNHVAKLKLLLPHTEYDYEGTPFPFDIFLCSRSDRGPKTWHELTFDFKP